VAAAGAVPALRLDLPGEARLCPQASADHFCNLCPRNTAARNAHIRTAGAESQRASTLEPRPDTDGLPGPVLRNRGGRAVGQLPPGRYADSPSATEVGD